MCSGAGAGSGSTESPEKVWEALAQSQVRFQETLVQNQVRFNRVPEKVPGEGLGGLGAEPGEVRQGPGEGSRALVLGEVSFNGFWRRLRRRLGQVQRGSEEGSEKVPENFFLLFLCVSTLRTCKNKTLRLWGIPPELICVPPSCRCHGCVSLYYLWIFPHCKKSF